MNNFNQQLQATLNNDFDNFYRHYFKGVTKIEYLESKDYQDRGIDKFVELDNGNVIYVEEKRRFNYYPDVVLEIIKNLNKGSSGWLLTCEADFIMYYIPPETSKTPGKMIVLPVPELQYTFLDNKETWLKKYPTKIAQNYSYDTVNLIVPIEDLLKAVDGSSCHDWTL